MAFQSATCPSCSGELQIPDDEDVISCMYCGSDIVVQETLNKNQSPDPENFLNLAQSALESNNSQEAIKYANKVLEIDPKNYEAWLVKAEATGWQSSLNNLRVSEMAAGFEKAIKYAPENKKESIKKNAASKINDICSAFYQKARNHFDEFKSVDDSWGDYLLRCELLIKSLEMGHNFDPSNLQLIKNIVYVCRDNLEGAIGEHRDGARTIQYEQEVSEKYEEELREKRKKYIKKANNIDPTFEPAKIEKKEATNCFVVTAVAGDKHRITNEMRTLRDRFLLNSSIGKSLINKYYKYGPLVANKIQNSNFLKVMTKYILLYPIFLIILSINIMYNKIHKPG